MKEGYSQGEGFTMRLFARRCLSRVRGVQALVEEWDLHAHHTTLVADLEQLVCECLDVVEVTTLAWQPLSAMLRMDPNTEEVEFAGQAWKRALGMLEAAINELRIAISYADKQGHTIESSKHLEPALKQVRDLHKRCEGIFPTFDPVAAEESRAAFLRGECITTEELLRELQGSGVGAD